MPIRVLIVDDSQLIRELLKQVLSSDTDIDVVGEAVDPLDAREKIKQLNPDVITLDIEMPRMDGLTFLKNIMRLRPMPVVMISTLTAKGAQFTFDALQLGAVDFVSKPRSNVSETLPAIRHEIVEKVKMASSIEVKKLAELPNQQPNQQTIQQHQIKTHSKRNKNFDLIVIGSSTGGTEAIKAILSELPADMPPILIVQHMPPGFTASFAERLDKQVSLTVKEFNLDYAELKSGVAYLAAGDRHMLLQRSGNRYRVAASDAEPVNRHKPAVDVTMNAVAQRAGSRSIGVILTGMGSDGALGLKAMYESGAVTVAQDEESSVVWGMPGSAVKLGAVKNVLPISKIASYLVEECYR